MIPGDRETYGRRIHSKLFAIETTEHISQNLYNQ